MYAICKYEADYGTFRQNGIRPFKVNSKHEAYQQCMEYVLNKLRKFDSNKIYNGNDVDIEIVETIF